MLPTHHYPLVKDKYLCLDFLNTEFYYKQELVEQLPTALAAIEWLFTLHVFTDPADQALLRVWAAEVTSQIISQLRALRADIRRLLDALRAGQALPAPELARMQALLRAGSRTGQLVEQPPGSWQWHSRLALLHPTQLAIPVAESFAQLLVDGNSSRVKVCARDTCTIHFYDTTKNQRRTWCDYCATQVKALRYYHRQKEKTS